jgi:hypothetical protein
MVERSEGVRRGKAPWSQDSSDAVLVMFEGTKRGPSFALLPTSMCCPFTRLLERETLGRVVMKLSSVTGTKAQFP